MTRSKLEDLRNAARTEEEKRVRHIHKASGLFSTLPQELIEYISGLLDQKDRNSLRLTCVHLSSIVLPFSKERWNRSFVEPWLMVVKAIQQSYQSYSLPNVFLNLRNELSWDYVRERLSTFDEAIFLVRSVDLFIPGFCKPELYANFGTNTKYCAQKIWMKYYPSRKDEFLTLHRMVPLQSTPFEVIFILLFLRWYWYHLVGIFPPTPIPFWEKK